QQRLLRFARFGETLETVGARRLEHSIARNRIAFGEDQRLVDERTEMIESGPAIDALVARDLLCGFERKAAREDRETPEDGALAGREERVAPFERRAQRLMPAQHDARTGRQQLEALVEARSQSLDAEQRQPRGCELDRERNAVEAPANLDHRRQILRRQ